MLASTQTVLSRPSTPNKSIKSISADTNFFPLNTYEENNKEVRSPTSVACTNNSEKTRVTHSSSSAFASGSFFDQQYIDCLYLDFDLTFSLTSTKAETFYSVDECLSIYQNAANVQGVSYQKYCQCAKIFVNKIQALGISVVILTMNNRRSVFNGLTAMGITKTSCCATASPPFYSTTLHHFEILSVYDMQQQSANESTLTKAAVLQQHSVSRGFVTSIFVDDSEQEISNMKNSAIHVIYYRTTNDERTVQVKTVQCTRPRRDTNEKGGMFNYPKVQKEILQLLTC